MATKTYTINYKVNADQARTTIAALMAQLQALIALARTSEQALQGMGNGMSKIVSANQSIVQINTNLAQTAANASSASAALANVGKGMGGRGGGGGGGFAMGGRLAPLAMGVMAARTAARIGAAAGQGVTDFETSSANQASQFRQARQEYASTMGRAAPTNKELSGDLLRMVRTGASAGEMNAFTTNYAGVISSALKPGAHGEAPLMTGKQSDDYGEAMLGLGVRSKQNVDQFAQLSGLNALNTSLPTNTERIGVMGQAVEAQQRAVQTVPELAGPIKNLIGSLVAGPDEFDEDGNPMKMKFGNVSEASTAVEQLSRHYGNAARVTSAFARGKTVLNKILYDPKFRGTNKKVGLTGDDDFMGAIGKLKTAVGDDDPIAWLYKNKLKESSQDRDMEILIQEHDNIKKQTDANRKDLPAAAERVMAGNKAFLSTATGRELVADAQKESGEIGRGLERETYVKQLRPAAQARLTNKGEFGGMATGTGTRGMMDQIGSMATLNVSSGEQITEDAVIVKGLREGARAAGIRDLDQRVPGLSLAGKIVGRTPMDVETLHDSIEKAARMITAAGGDPTGKSGERIVQLLQETNATLRDIRGGGDGAAPAGPGPAASAPAGADRQ